MGIFDFLKNLPKRQQKDTENTSGNQEKQVVDAKPSQQKATENKIYDVQHYMQLADQYAHLEAFFCENPEQKTLEAQLLDGGSHAQAAIVKYLTLCGSERTAYGWWNGAADLTRMLRKIGGKSAEEDLQKLKSVSTNIWEYHTQVIETAEKELLALKKETTGYGSDNRIPPEDARAELLGLENVHPPEKRLEQFFAMQNSVDSWSNANKAFYYFIAGGAARVLYPENKSNLAFYAAQVFCKSDPTSAGWQYLRQAESTPLAATEENAKRMHEKYPLPKNMEETRTYAHGFIVEKEEIAKSKNETYTLDLGLNELTALFRAYPQLNRTEIKAVGQKIYDAGIPLVNGVGGMHQLYARFRERMPMHGAELSRIWDGVGDWAD